MPVLGVCLGMQALAHANGAAVVRAPEPVHGRLSNIRHAGHRLFQGIPSGASRCDQGFAMAQSMAASLSKSLVAILWQALRSGTAWCVTIPWWWMRPRCRPTCPP